ncbi:MAG: hypothetical protein CM15mP85_13920 [Rhodobacterales bacterium]|nr:MAG: hypothetical protein CM15mP85_13920 [Rhodobacterales bacterium]
MRNPWEVFAEANPEGAEVEGEVKISQNWFIRRPAR